MSESKAGKGSSSGRGRAKTSNAKRRSTSSQTPTKKPPSKAAIKQQAKDWDQVT